MDKKEPKKITVSGTEITINELTAGQGKKILDNLNDQNLKIVDMLFPDRICADAVIESTGLSNDELGNFTPSELEEIIKEVETLNPTFASLVKRLATVGRKILEQNAEKQ